jgi:hypothetical protein
MNTPYTSIRNADPDPGGVKGFQILFGMFLLNIFCLGSMLRSPHGGDVSIMGLNRETVFCYSITTIKKFAPIHLQE